VLLAQLCLVLGYDIICLEVGGSFLTYGAIILLAIVQGLTEFLPISSSGHLVLAQHLLGVSSPGVALEVALHLGTLLSVIIVFSSDIWRLLEAAISLLQDPQNMRSEQLVPYRRLLWLLVVSTIPTGVIGFAFADSFEQLFSAPRFVGYALMLTGLILLYSSKRYGQRALADVTIKDSLWVGVAQGLAITPGISRSGTTIAAGLSMGFDRDTATRYSFLLSLPAVIGAAILKLPELWTEAAMPPWSHVLLGVAISAMVGVVAIWYLVAMLKKGRLQYFAYYALAVGLVTILFV